MVGAIALAFMGSMTEPAVAQPPGTPDTGRIVGHVTKSTGEPVGSGFVIAYDATTQQFRAFGNIDAQGAYTLSGLPAGSYKVQFSGLVSQWAHRKTSFADADAFAVTAGQDTVVDEVGFPTGSVTVTATDQVTGAPVSQFCADISGSGVLRHGCTETGSVTLTDIRPGDNYFLTVTGVDDRYFSSETSNVRVVADQTTTVPVVLEPSALINTTIEDAATHAPVPGACVFAVTGIGGFGNSAFDCSGADGHVLITNMHTAPYQLYVFARDGAHGDQWVGPSGGTGSRYLATTIHAQGGQTTSMAPIRLDPAGSISGTVVDKATGAPVEGVCAFSHAGGTTGGPDQAPYCTGPDGRYTISGLGPYLWPVQFIDTIGSHTWQWSGDRPTQLTAKPVRVRAGQTTTENAHLGVGATISGRVTNTAGRLPGTVFVYNAITGDMVAGWANTDENGNFQLAGVAGPQFVRVKFDDGVVNGTTGWYRHTQSFGSATPILVRPGATVSGIDFTVP
jgi:hypothetical protein